MTTDKTESIYSRIDRDAIGALAAKYDVKVPRYTSYPTAPHFSDAVDEYCYRSWLEKLDSRQPVSLYIHIPFCDSMCWFCGCYTKIVNRYEPITDYLETLKAEIASLTKYLPVLPVVAHMHFGGGSPSLLKPDDWQSLIGCLRNHFPIASNAEIAIELDPRDVSEAYVVALARAGINRVSIGVQDFGVEVQAAINRKQPFAQVAQVCAWLREAGIAAINMDLMYGLPLQTVDGLLATVDRVVELAPSRLALFGYAHVPWMKSHQSQIDGTTLPDVAERLRQYLAASAHLGACGYQAIGLDHFARPGDALAEAAITGHVHRNFQGYTTDTAATLFGFGASAIGTLPQGYVQNTAPLRSYRQTVREGGLPVARGLALTNDDRLRRAIIEHLMSHLSVDVGGVCEEYGADATMFDNALEALLPMLKDDLITIEGRRISMTALGRPFVRLTAAAFDAYLDVDSIRHAQAV